MYKKILKVIALPLVLVLSLSACNGQSNVDTTLRAPEFKLPSIDGKVVSLSELRGTPVFLTFWETS